ncbi:MAG: hypothetical protein GWP04_02580 [Gammaproteobacteria bacterium]|nr:hypothetical protein [Gammaproteobacteria bacterium]
MNDPIEALNTASIDEWADPLGTAAIIAEAIHSLVDRGWAEGLAAVQQLRRRRADSPLMLAVTEPALDPDPRRVKVGLDEVERKIRDTSWTQELGLRLAHDASLGVLSLGDATLSILEVVAFRSSQETDLFVDRSSIARGLGYLRLPIVVAPPEEASVVLIPATARFRNRIWTTARAADIALRAKAGATRVVPVVHPLAVLSPLSRTLYRPAATLIDVEI